MKKAFSLKFISLILAITTVLTAAVPSYATAGKYSDEAIEETAKIVSDNIVEIARAEIGFYEDDINKYTTWYYGRENGSSWCCIFVSWCAAQVGVLDSAIPQRASCSSMRNWFKLRNQYYPVDSGYSPVKGDIVFYNVDVDGTDNVNHVEIITEDGYQSVDGIIGVKSIGGNTSDPDYHGYQYVTEKFRAAESSKAQIVGFCHPSYHKADRLIGKLNSFSDEIRKGDMRFIHSKYISLIYRIENFWYNFFNMFNEIKLF